MKSSLGSSVISSPPFVFSLAGSIGSVPAWTIGDYTIAMNFILVLCQIPILRAEVRPHAALPARHRFHLRMAHRPQHAADLGLECVTLPAQLLAQFAGAHDHGRRHRFRGAVRLGDDAGRGHLDRHQPGDAASFREGQDRCGYAARAACRRRLLLPLFGSWQWNVIGVGTLFRDGLRRTSWSSASPRIWVGSIACWPMSWGGSGATCSVWPASSIAAAPDRKAEGGPVVRCA